jgi:hypothetical protein
VRPALTWILGCALILPFYGVLRIGYFQAGPVERVPDTATYEKLDFLARGSNRLFTVPLLYHFIGSDQQRAGAQLMISIFCWALLALAVARATRTSYLKPVTFALVLFFSLSTPILVWDRFLMAESAGASLTAALVAVWLLFLGRSSLWTLGLLAGTTLLFAFVRETHAALTAGFLCVLLPWLALPGEKRYRVLAAASVAAIAGWSLFAVSQNRERRRFNMQNVIAQRILTDPARLAHFERAGMPVTPKLLSLGGKYASSDGWAFYEAPELESFRMWLDQDFEKAYVRYLLNHPRWALAAPFGDSRLFSPDPRQPPFSGYFERQSLQLPRTAQRFLYPDSTWLLLVLLLIVAASATWAGIRRGLVCEAAVSILLVLSTIPHGLIVWHGDAGEVARHGVPVATNLRLGLVLLLLQALDGLLAKAPRARWLPVTGVMRRPLPTHGHGLAVGSDPRSASH